MMLRRLCGDRRGTTAVEFAIVASALVTLSLGIMEAGLLFWAKATLEATAALTARCGATGFTWGTTTCTTAATTQSYAVSTAGNWIAGSVIDAADVTVTSAASSCNGVSGTFFIVTISCAFFAGLPAPLSNYTLSVTACYPQS
jgi:Flp pilus assembly protein TadG